MTTVKWGIIGAGNISKKFASDVVQTENGKLVAVASNTLEKAQKFVEPFENVQACSYEELLNNPEIDIVYIGTLHPMHKDGVVRCLEAGKSVLCEKPFMMNAEETKEVIELAKEKGLFLMEAMWTRYLPVVVQTKKWIAEGRIGDVTKLIANFGFDIGFQPEHRLLNKELGGGALLDAGIYPVSFASFIFNEQPKNIMSTAHIGETGVDEHFSAIFEYENSKSAVLSAGVRLQLSNDAFIYGTNGYIHVEDFLFGRKATLYEKGKDPVEMVCDRQVNGYFFEAEEAMECLRAGEKESAVMPLQETYEIMSTMDQLRKQWGLEY